MSQIQYMNGPNTNTLSAYIPEFNNNNNNNESFTGYPPLVQQPQQQPVQIPIINNNNVPPLYPGNNTPVLMNNMSMPIIEENGSMKRFNLNATRSNSSSSSTSSSAMSSLSMYQNKFNNNEFNDFESELLDLKHRNDLSKLFEDDIFYCPRSLLSKQDILRAERLIVEERLKHNSPFPNNNPIIESPNLNMVNMHSTKFNPYTSKSFNPTNF